MYINAGGNKRLFQQVNKFTPPILMMFFVLAGLNLNLPSLATAGLIGVVYFLVRILGKYVGCFTGARLCGYTPSVQKYLGLAPVSYTHLPPAQLTTTKSSGWIRR